MDEDDDGMSSLAMDPIVPLLIKQGLPITLENWRELAGYEPEDLEDAEIMGSVPWELLELDEGEAVHPWRYYEAVAELPAGVPPMGRTRRWQLTWARLRLWLRRLSRRRA